VDVASVDTQTRGNIQLEWQDSRAETLISPHAHRLKKRSLPITHEPPPVSVAKIYALRGAIYWRQCKIDLAVADFENAVNSNPSDAEVLVNRAVIRLRSFGDFSRAFSDFDMAVDLSRRDQMDGDNRILSYSLWQRADARLRLAQYELALSDFEAALRARPTPDAYRGRAMINLIEGDDGAVQRDLERALELDSQNLEAHRLLGIFCLVCIQAGESGATLSYRALYCW